ncbi:TPA: ribose-5-phosphate isomerase, partial [Candidatus Woesearchaeota archaeon]|nr:ribose-5-phosphate isomerase [Candidatus Woesearchaeota archaeon]
MKLYIASDHGGFKVKKKLQSYLEKKGHTVVD